MPIQGDFDSLTTRQLRKECTSRAIDLTGCFDKDAILQRLRQAVTKDPKDRRRDAAGSSDVALQKEVPSEAPPAVGENGQTIEKAADAKHAQGDVGASQEPSAEEPPAVGENVDVAPSHERAADATHAQGNVGASQEPSAEAPPAGGENVDVAPSHERAADATHAQGDVGASQEPSAEELPAVGENVDVAPSHERAADATHAQGDVGASQEPSAEAPPAVGENVDVAPSHERVSERPDSNIDIEEASYEVFSNDLIKGKQLKTCAKWAASEEIAAAAKRGLALNSSKLADRSALEVIPMRALMKECKLMGLDVSGLYAKCEVIKKLLGELNRAAEEQLGSKMKEETPGTNEMPRGDTQIPEDLEEGKQAELLPPTGPPIVLSPFPKKVETEPEPPVDPPSDPFEFLGNRVVEEETTAQDPPHGDLESDVEEIELEASPEAKLPQQEVWKAPAVPQVFKEEAPSCTAEVVPKVAAHAAPRPRASISELFRLPLEDLLLRCEAEGINVVPGESKGMLISRLKQAMSRCTEALRSVEKPDQPMPPAAATAETAETAEMDTVAAAATAVPSTGHVPSPGPQVFHMASDESQDEGAAEDSDGDFFPDFPVRKEPEASCDSTTLEEASCTAQDVKIAEAQPQTQAAHEEESQQERFENTEGPSTFSGQPPAAPEKLAEAEPASAQLPSTPPASDPDPTLFTDPEKDGDHGASSSERDGAMFDFDDLDEAEVHVTPKQTDSHGPSVPAPVAEPIAPSVSARPTVDPVEAVVEPAPAAPAEGPEAPPAKAEEVGSQNDDGLKNPLLRFTTKELLELARSRGVDVRGCVEKSDIVDRLTRAPRAAPPPVPARPSRPAPSRPGIPASKPSAPGPSEFQFRTANSSFQGTAKAPSPMPRRPAKAHATKAVRRPEVPPPSSPPMAPQRHPGEIPDGWSARVQTWFGRYPGFSAMLPPEAEMWTDQELDVYFGSNGDIWPRGKRPAWFGRPSTEPDAKSIPKPQGPRVYPDLKVHFQTLDLAETTPPEILRRHYRRLARDIHPDKHPENVEEATRRFQQVTEAYEAIAARLKL